MYCRIVLIVIFSASQSAFGTFAEISLYHQTELGKLLYGLKSPKNLLFLIKTVMVISSMVLEFLVKQFLIYRVRIGIRFGKCPLLPGRKFQSWLPSAYIQSGKILKKSPKEFHDEYFRHRLG